MNKGGSFLNFILGGLQMQQYQWQVLEKIYQEALPENQKAMEYLQKICQPLGIEIKWILNQILKSPVTLNFHPDRLSGSGKTVLEGMMETGFYCGQFQTGTTNGGLGTSAGSPRRAWEDSLFHGLYPEEALDRPKYGALNVFHYLDGASMRFGSCFSPTENSGIWAGIWIFPLKFTFMEIFLLPMMWRLCIWMPLIRIPILNIWQKISVKNIESNWDGFLSVSSKRKKFLPCSEKKAFGPWRKKLFISLMDRTAISMRNESDVLHGIARSIPKDGLNSEQRKRFSGFLSSSGIQLAFSDRFVYKFQENLLRLFSFFATIFYNINLFMGGDYLLFLFLL